MQTQPTAVSATTQYTLREAVLDAVNTLKSKGSFSAHDVTDAVRSAANDSEYALPGLESQSGGSYKYNVRHDSVKEVVDALLNDGTLANLGLKNVDYSGAYRVFEFDVPSSTIAAASNPATSADVDADVVASDGPVAQRIKVYLDNAGSATLKQIQSALKVNGLTCKDLATVVDELGYTVTPGTPECFSTYTVHQ